jgi:hypothetical protein
MIHDPSAATTDPMGKDSRHPDEILMLFFCLMSGLGIVLGGAPDPASIEASLPNWGRTIWGIALLLGPLTTIAGILWAKRHSRDGILIEQVGQIMTGGVALFYVGVLVINQGENALVSVAFILAFSLARFWRWWQLERIVRVAATREGDRRAG